MIQLCGIFPPKGLKMVFMHQIGLNTELQKRADRADQSVLFFLAGANFWEKHMKNC